MPKGYYQKDMINQRLTVNPIGCRNVDRSKYVDLWTNYDINQVVSRFKWENLPNGLTSFNLERMLYFRGSLVGFKKDEQIYVLPYAATGDLNLYGFPTAVKPIAFNGRETGGSDAFGEYSLPVDVYGNEDMNAQAVILYDSIPYNTAAYSPCRYHFNQILIQDIADTLARVNINVVVSNKKIGLIIKDPNQKAIVEEELKRSFAADSPFFVISSPLEVQEIQSTSDYQADDLFNTIKNYDAMRCFMNGINSNNFGNEKKERLITAELSGNDDQVSLIIDLALELRQHFADKMNELFGTNIKVYKRAVEYEESEENIEDQAVEGGAENE